MDGCSCAFGVTVKQSTFQFTDLKSIHIKSSCLDMQKGQQTLWFHLFHFISIKEKIITREKQIENRYNTD